MTPFGAINDEAVRVGVVLGDAVMRHEGFNIRPMVNAHIPGLASADLVKFMRTTGRELLIVAFGGKEAQVE